MSAKDLLRLLYAIIFKYNLGILSYLIFVCIVYARPIHRYKLLVCFVMIIIDPDGQSLKQHKTI